MQLISARFPSGGPEYDAGFAWQPAHFATPELCLSESPMGNHAPQRDHQVGHRLVERPPRGRSHLLLRVAAGAVEAAERIGAAVAGVAVDGVRAGGDGKEALVVSAAHGGEPGNLSRLLTAAGADKEQRGRRPTETHDHSSYRRRNDAEGKS